MTPTCCGGVPMRPRPTISHGMCHTCSVCGKWCEQMTATECAIAYANGFGPIRWDPPAPPIALHHLPSSPN